VLILAWVDREALVQTFATGEAHFWSRSRRELWHKGATSGNVQRVRGAALDCDRDAVLLWVEPAGPACHTGAGSCFDDEASGGLAWGERPVVYTGRAVAVGASPALSPERVPIPVPGGQQVLPPCEGNRIP